MNRFQTASTELQALVSSFDLPLVAVVPASTPRRASWPIPALGVIILLACWVALLALLVE